MKVTKESPKPLQLVFNISAVRFNRPGYFFLKLTAENGATPVGKGGDSRGDDVWVKMPELNHCFMHAYSRINDPIKQRDPNEPVIVGDGQFTFFLSREFLEGGKKENLCIWIEAFEFLDLNDDDKLKKIGEVKYKIFADYDCPVDKVADYASTTPVHEIKCQVTHVELPIPSDYSQMKKCPGRYVELYIDDAKISSFNMNLCLSSVDVDIRSYDEILERATRFVPPEQPEDIKTTENPVIPESSPDSMGPEKDAPMLAKVPVKSVSSIPVSSTPSRLWEFGSSFLHRVKRKERAMPTDKGLSEAVRSLLYVKANTAQLVGRLPLGVKQIEFGVNAIVGSILPAVAPAMMCGSPVSASNNNANSSDHSTPRPSGLHTPGTDAVDEEVRNVTGRESRRPPVSHMSLAPSVELQVSDKDLSEQLNSQMEELDKYRQSASKLNVEIESLREKITALEVQNKQLKRQSSLCLDCHGFSPSKANCSIGTTLPSITTASRGVNVEDELDLTRTIKGRAVQDVQLGRQMMQMEQTYEQQLAVLQQLQVKRGSVDRTADSLMDEIKVMLTKQKKEPSDDGLKTNFDRLFLLDKLTRAQSRIESLEKQLHENAKVWGKEKSNFQLRLLESEKGLPRPLSPATTLKTLKWKGVVRYPTDTPWIHPSIPVHSELFDASCAQDMRRASFGMNISRRMNTKTNAVKQNPQSYSRQSRRR